VKTARWPQSVLVDFLMLEQVIIILDVADNRIPGIMYPTITDRGKVLPCSRKPGVHKENPKALNMTCSKKWRRVGMLLDVRFWPKPTNRFTKTPYNFLPVRSCNVPKKIVHKRAGDII
jgi:hypothetical protein